MKSWLSLALALLAYGALGAEEPIPQLDLDHRCGQCHDVTGDLTSERWLQRLQELGPIDKLTPAQQTEALGFLRHHGWEINQIVQMAGDRHLFEEKCSLCHSADRAFIRALTPEQRRATLERMRARARLDLRTAAADHPRVPRARRPGRAKAEDTSREVESLRRLSRALLGVPYPRARICTWRRTARRRSGRRSSSACVSRPRNGSVRRKRP